MNSSIEQSNRSALASPWLTEEAAERARCGPTEWGFVLGGEKSYLTRLRRKLQVKDADPIEARERAPAR